MERQKRAADASTMSFWKQHPRDCHALGMTTSYWPLSRENTKMPGLGLNQGRAAPALRFLGSLSSNFQNRDVQTANPPTRQRLRFRVAGPSQAKRVLAVWLQIHDQPNLEPKMYCSLTLFLRGSGHKLLATGLGYSDFEITLRIDQVGTFF